MTKTAEPFTILLLDDDPIIAMDAAMEIEDWGHVCHVAHDLNSAFELLRTISLDAALLDYDLGGETSVPLAAELHHDRKPFAFVTGRDMGEVSKEIGVEPIVYTKPVDYADVARSLLA